MAPSLYILVVQHERNQPVTNTLAAVHKESLEGVIAFTELLPSPSFSLHFCSACYSLSVKRHYRVLLDSRKVTSGLSIASYLTIKGSTVYYSGHTHCKRCMHCSDYCAKVYRFLSKLLRIWGMIKKVDIRPSNRLQGRG